MSYLRYLCIVVSNTYCVVFLFCFSSSCGSYVASFSGFFLLIALSVFSNVFYMLSCILMMVFVKLFWLINTYPEVNILTHSLIR